MPSAPTSTSASVQAPFSKRAITRFPSGSQLILSVSAPDIASERYLDRLRTLIPASLRGEVDPWLVQVQQRVQPRRPMARPLGTATTAAPELTADQRTALERVRPETLEEEHGLPVRTLVARMVLARVPAIGAEARDIDTWQDLSDLREG